VKSRSVFLKPRLRQIVEPDEVPQLDREREESGATTAVSLFTLRSFDVLRSGSTSTNCDTNALALRWCR
jgi:hypothetical protein